MKRCPSGMTSRNAHLHTLLALSLATMAAATETSEKGGPQDPAEPKPLKLIVENATIIPVDGSGTYIDGGYMTVDVDGRIVDIGEGLAPPNASAPKVLDAAGKFIMPGFLSGHSHLYQSPWRGLGIHYTLHGWIVCYHMTYGPYYGEGDQYWYSQHGAMDYLGHGITTIYDWTLNSNMTVDAYTDLFRGSLASGARIIFGYGPDLGKSLEENRVMLKEYLDIIKREGIDPAHPRVPAVWMSGLGLLNGPESATMEFTLANEFDLPMQVHYLEEPQADYVAYQQRIFHVYEDTDVLGPDFNFAHFINVTDEILEKTAETGTTMVWNPLSNGRLASGLPDIPKYAEMGIGIGMGIDGQASADVSDPFENMRLGMYATRMKYQDGDILMPLDMIRFHTIGTAQVMGVADQVGSLEPGKFADFLVIDPRNMETSPPIHPIEHIVLTCSVANLEQVYVGGELNVERGDFKMVDYERVKDEVTWRVERVIKKVEHARATGTLEIGELFANGQEWEQQTFIHEHEHPRYGRPSWHKSKPTPRNRANAAAAKDNANTEVADEPEAAE